MAFETAYRENRGPIYPREFYIATGTAIEKGEIVQFTVGVGIAALGSDGTDFDVPALGIAAEAHDGATAGRQVSTKILVYADPDIVFKNIPKTLSTTTSGDATSWIDSSLTAANDVFNGGKIVIVSTNSITGFSVGDVLDITDFVNTGGDCTVTGAGGTIASGMTGYIYPGKRAVTCHGFDLNSDGTSIDLDTAGGESLNIVDTDYDAQLKETTVFCKLRVHQFGNHCVEL
jgi:hypothetical protein